MRSGMLFRAMAVDADGGGCNRHNLVDGSADGGDKQVVDQNEGGGQKNALAQILGVEVPHGQSIDGNADDKENAVIALPQKGAHDRHNQGQHDGDDPRDVPVLILVHIADVAYHAHDVESQGGGASQHSVGDAGHGGGNGVGHKDLGGGLHLIGDEGDDNGHDADDLTNDLKWLHENNSL